MEIFLSTSRRHFLQCTKTTTNSKLLLRSSSAFIQHGQRRTIFDFSMTASTGPASAPQRFEAQRILPHSPRFLFDIITDIDSYSSFIPYCTRSLVTSRSKDTENGSGDGGGYGSGEKRLPTEAELKIGWGMFEETFTSELQCSSDHHDHSADYSDEESDDYFDDYSDSLSSSSSSTSSTEQTENTAKNFRGRLSIVQANATRNSVFHRLEATWKIKDDDKAQKRALHKGWQGQGNNNPQPRFSSEGRNGHSDVHLEIVYKFANPLYERLSEAVMPSVAGKIIEAFEKRANEVKKASLRRN